MKLPCQPIRPFLTCGLLLLTLLAAQGECQEPDLKAQIQGLLTEQTKAWNAGDLEAFMQTYWKSEKLSFSSGGNTTYGWQATLDRYRKGYAPPKEMGKLQFDGLEVTSLGPRAALVLGNWHLTMPDDSIREGNFSLVLRKMERGWKIIHDHSSKKEDDESEEQ